MIQYALIAFRNIEGNKMKKYSLSEALGYKKPRRKARKLNPQELRGLINEQYREVLLEDADAAGVDDSRFPMKLRQAAAKAGEEAERLVTMGDEDGEENDDTVQAKEDSCKVSKLAPSQTSMNIDKAVAFAIAALLKNDPFPTGPGGNLGAIISSDNHIMDGHHRWSSVWGILGKEAGGKIAARDLDLPGGTEEKLAATQLAVAAHKAPDLPQPSEGDPFPTNILGASSETIEQMIRDNVGNQTDPNAPGALLNNEFLSAAAQSQQVAEWAGFEMGADHSTVIDAIAKKVAGNLSDIPSNSGAPARADMPQVDHKTMGPDQDATKAAIYTGLESGKFNVSLPFDPVEEGTKKPDSLIMERWQRLAGLLQD